METTMQADAINTLLDTACEPYRRAGKFAWHFARGKLGRDPAFKGILARGLLTGRRHILDIGCGQGLLASWLLSARRQYESGHWPQGWPAPPELEHVRGIELMPKDVERANESLKHHGQRVKIEVGNMCSADFGSADAVVILDVLHYVDFPAQDDVLCRVRDCLTPGGVLLLRVGDAAGGLPFRMSNWVDNVVTWVRGHRTLPRYCRTLANWKTHIAALGFVVESMPMNEGTPFANILLVCKKV
jgi:SAM-dependent methyltransferase